MSEVIKLGVAVTDADGAEITQLEMRRPKVRDHIWLKTKYGSKESPKKNTKSNQVYDEMDRDLAMYARLTDQPEEVIESLDLGDWGKLATSYITLSQPLSASTN